MARLHNATFTVAGALALLTTTMGTGRGSETSSQDVLRIGFTNAMFAEVNESDGKASVRALAATIARERGLPADPEPHVFRNVNDATAALERHVVNTIGLTAAEYAGVRRRVAFEGHIFGVFDGDPTETYVLLTAASDPATTLANLRGRDLAVLTGPRMSLAIDWLDLELARLGAPPSSEFFRRKIVSGKPSKIILPVFFRQVPACLVTRRAFETMAELNPQIRRQLREIASSPPYVPSFFAIATGFSSPFLQRVLREFSQIHTTPAGQQVLTIFQTDRVAAGSDATLDATLAMLDEHAHLEPRRGGATSAKGSQ